MSSSQLFSNKNLAYSFGKVNPFGGKMAGRIAKSLVELRRGLGHNAGETGGGKMFQNAAPYVNECNHLTQHVAKKREKATISCGDVNIIFTIKSCKKLANRAKTQEILDN